MGQNSRTAHATMTVVLVLLTFPATIALLAANVFIVNYARLELGWSFVQPTLVTLGIATGIWTACRKSKRTTPTD